MENADISKILIVVATGLMCTASIGHAGILDDFRGAIDTVREATDTVNDAKDATQDAKDLIPADEEEKSAPPVQARPPALPSSTQWHVSMNGKSAGPFPASKIGSLISKGQVTRESLVWKEGMGKWVRADSVAEISRLFAAKPPPLPPK